MSADQFLKALAVAALIAHTLGLNHIAADVLRALWRSFKGHAASTPSKLDDAFVNLFGSRVDRVIELVDAGDLAGAKQRLDQIKDALGGR